MTPQDEPTTRTGGGPKSALKVAVPLLALVGLVFGITYFGQYVPPEPDKVDQKGANGDGGSGTEPPLRFFTSTRLWDPPLLVAPGYRHFPLLAPSAIAPPPEPESGRAFSFTLQDRIFQGYYESGETARSTPFWFENRNPNPVTMQLKGVSCTACSGGRLAAIPPETTKNLLQHAALAALPLGAFNPYGVALSQPGAALFGMTQPEGGLTPLPWVGYEFRDNPNATFHVPAAASGDKWAPQWGILELTFKVGDNPKLPLIAGFATQVDGTTQSGSNQFSLRYEPAKAFVLDKSLIDVGRLEPLSADREYPLLVYSTTRGPGSEFGDLILNPQDFLVQAPLGVTDAARFIEVTKVVRVPEAELVDIVDQLATDQKRLTKVRSAYRMMVAVRPKVGEQRLDIGHLERTVTIAAGGATQQLQIKGSVRGAVQLDNNLSEITLGSFNGSKGLVHQVDLTTEKAGLELALVKGDCRPPGFTYELEKQPDRGEQGHYRLKVTAPPGLVFGQIRNGVVVMEVKGPTPQRIRIPVSGSGTF